MRPNRMIALFFGIALFLPLATSAQAMKGVGKNVEALLQEILSNQQNMQAEIQRLKDQMAQKDREIAELRQLLHARSVLDPSSTIANTADTYAAQIQYEKARDLMHETIFEVRKGEQKLWFERVLVEFRKVVDSYPKTIQASEAQLRIARIYRRYLNDVDKAKAEYQKLIDTYPDSEDIQEARSALLELQ